MSNTISSPIAVIVEDTLDAAQLMQIALRRAGIEAHHAADGRSALEVLEQVTPDVLLLDIGMPDMSGWTVLEYIKSRFPDTYFPIIVLTAFDDPANKLIGKLQSRVFRYVTKPFEPAALMQTVQEAIAAKQTRSA
ncbi:MAG: response regulator [Anaerolineae bacterium]|nr:response regulator [Anaerolineae bacterium]MBN8619577.1 response regulator [Anaerolineae bacterium]